MELTVTVKERERNNSPIYAPQDHLLRCTPRLQAILAQSEHLNWGSYFIPVPKRNNGYSTLTGTPNWTSGIGHRGRFSGGFEKSGIAISQLIKKKAHFLHRTTKPCHIFYTCAGQCTESGYENSNFYLSRILHQENSFPFPFNNSLPPPYRQVTMCKNRKK